MAMQYFHEIGQPRYHFIVRKHSYHGNTLGALSTGGHIARRKIYEEALMKNVSCVSECNPYRQRLEGQTDVEFVAAKAAELDREFQRVGCNKVVAFMCEPISGAALGCAPYVPGYLAAMKVVCVKYGALFILDEIMSGMGRCGTLHAWQAEHSEKPGRDCVPDIQMIAKGVAAGFMPVGAFMVGPKVVGALSRGTGAFVHGQTYQAFPTCCAAIVKVQTIVRDENLLDNVRKQGAYLSTLLHQRLDSHPNVGDIRGMGLFWGIEFVEDKEAKEPFIPELNIAKKIRDLALSEKYGMTFYPGQGSKDGLTGDHIIIAPAYNITAEDVELIVDTAVAVIEETFQVL
jgi:adenosylmethionine-8-amino-7-oxononanoate aminotransferase